MNKHARDHYRHQLNQWIEQLADGCFVAEARFPVMNELRDTLSFFHQHKDDRLLLNLPDLIDSVCDLAIQLSDWPLLISIHHYYSSTCFSLQQNRDNQHLLLHAYACLGQFKQAVSIASRILLAEPNNQAANDYLIRLQTYVHAFDFESVDKALYLTPLQHWHLNDFFWQYDVSVVNLCDLPDFIDHDDWHDWLDHLQHKPESIALAIMHQQWGFMGCVYLDVHQGIGCFYYWLGQDFRANGFGPRAAQLLLQYGREMMNMDCCYTQIYQNNHYSHKAINKLGFCHLPIQARIPDEHACFYYHGPVKDLITQYNELEFLLYSTQSTIELMPNRLLMTLVG